MANNGGAVRTRNLVLCLDGTSNQFADKNTNVIKLFSVLDISPGYQREGQMAYYDSGVGTYLPVGASSTWSHARQEWGKNLDLAVAWNFDDHVKNAYKWLMDYYQPDDKIYLFGFSRGAYAVRVLAGMVERIGLLPAGLHCQIPLAYDVYQGASNRMAAKYRGIFGISREVNIHFIGVWCVLFHDGRFRFPLTVLLPRNRDTVSSLGGLSAPDLPFASAVSMVTYFRQALALDERRVKFQPEFRRDDPGVPPDEDDVDVDCLDDDLDDDLDDGLDPNIPRNKEVWFLGVHTSVGGGHDQDNGPSLSNIPFRWMLNEAVQCGLRTGPISILQSYAFMEIPTVQAYVQGILSANIRAHLNPLLPGNAVRNRALMGRIRREFTENRRRNVIRFAAQFDTSLSNVHADAAAGLPTTTCLLQPKHESLSGPAYFTMDYFPLGIQRRWYALDAAGNYVEHRDRWPHRGDGRYIQHGQKIHLSVLKRALYDQAVTAGRQPFPPVATYAPYPTITAHLAPSPGMPPTWQGLLQFANVPLALWEVV
ncbi:hypothetical protein QFC20_007698 [Naganishia adeliensis]|uniref:Uncharacterized protein n=1 Tax=Naganishia adeliensis TaxID=92952 RepID=A0ACC2UWG4_9TREE|nr:hypothetical protein QFC20_007698 [Naganishia adeliensis]